MYASPRERIASALAAFLVVLLTAAALVLGLRAETLARVPGALVSIFTAPVAKPEVKPPRKVSAAPRPSAKGDPSPRNLRNKATQVIAPPIVPLASPPPFVAAPKANVGDAASSGASDLPGPGQGAGGLGEGFGGEGEGGDGGGDGGGAVKGPRQIRGKLSFKDMPQGLLAEGMTASVGVRYTVDADGRVIGCRADIPSGYPALDALTCRLIEARFVFRPARNRAGRPVRSVIVERHSWFVKPREE